MEGDDAIPKEERSREHTTAAPSVANGAPSSNTDLLAPDNSQRSRQTSGSKICDKCELPMVGQFVRALGGTYHLECFRCQVSLFPAICRYVQTLMHLGLFQDCSLKVLSSRQSRTSWSAVSFVRNRLLQALKTTVSVLWRGIKRLVHNRTREKISYRTLYLLSMSNCLWPTRFLLRA